MIASRPLLWAAIAAACLVSGCSTFGKPSEECVLRVGSSGDYLPFSRRIGGDATATSWSGLDITIADRLATDLGCELELVKFRWPELMAEADAGTFDIALSGITMRAERTLHGTFSRPYARTGAVLLVRTGIAASSRDELDREGTVVAVNAGGHLERWARANLKNATLRAISDNRRLPTLLARSEVDAVVTDSAEAPQWAAGNDAVGRILGPFSTDFKAVFLTADRGDLAAPIDRWLLAREQDGWLSSLRLQHLRDAQYSGPEAATADAITALLRLRLGIMPMVASTKMKQGKKVTDARQEERVVARARAWAGDKEKRAQRLYPLFIGLAKEVQRNWTKPVESPTLVELRDAILGVDRQLVREIRRLPALDRERWLQTLAPVREGLPLGSDDLNDLATALAEVGSGG